ncbi:MAG: peptide deformylase [Candidatus Aquicultor sp.]|nr:peptide deformylase [Candidatus Aquicultor sp.]
MAILPIRVYPDPALKEKTRVVDSIDDDLRKLIKNMIDTMRAAPGIGLAANQIGVLKRVVVVDVDDDEDAMVLINPEITWYSEEREENEEGCLSVYPDKISVNVSRSLRIIVKAVNEHGEDVEFEAEGLFARAVQHEIDHINGKVIIDRTSAEERRIALRELTEQMGMG